jgi:hypothetical protein
MKSRAGDRVALGLVGLVLLVAGVAEALDGVGAASLVRRMITGGGAAATTPASGALDPALLSRAIVSALAGLETALGVLLLLRGRRGDALATAGLLVVLTAWIVALDLTLGWGTPCGCKVPFLSETGWVPLARNAALLALCTWTLRRGGTRPRGGGPSRAEAQAVRRAG